MTSMIPFIYRALDSTGNPLVGGKLYTYTDSTYTTLKATYTDPSGLYLAPNPLILDAYGQVIVYAPAGALYVNLLDSLGNQMPYYPASFNVPATIGSTGLSGIGLTTVPTQQNFVATAGQTVFTVTIPYVVGINNVNVYQNGVRLVSGIDFTETNTTTITLTVGASVNDFISIITMEDISDPTGVAAANTLRSNLADTTTPGNGQSLVGFNSNFSYGLNTLPGALLDTTTSGHGSSLVGYLAPYTGAVGRTQQSKNAETVSVKDFGAVGDGVTDDSAAFIAMFATGLPWHVPYTASGYLINTPLVITSSGKCEGQLIVKAGFAGVAVQIQNPIYSTKILVEGLNVYSTDVRPNPYTTAKTVGILVGPTATYSGNTPTPGVTLLNCRATRFSINLQISTFNVTILSGAYPQGDHNILVYSYDTSYNQVNDVSLIDVQADSATSTVGQAYGLRVGTTGNGTYTGNTNMGVNLKIYGCDFDGTPVYLDNIFGVDYHSNYHEQGVGYTYHGAAVIMGSAGAGYLQNVHIDNCWFTQFDYAMNLAAQVTNLQIGVCSYASIKYSALQVNAAESQTFKYSNGIALGSTPSWGASGYSEVQFNFSAGISVSQLTFAGASIFNDGLIAGSQLVANKNITTNWYPNGRTNDGWMNNASIYGRFRSSTAIQTGITGTQSGTNFQFTTPAQAALFNGGDSISASIGGASFIKSIDYASGLAVLDSSYTGSITISHVPANFLGVGLNGFGSPEGVITAPTGSFYLAAAGGSGTTLYVKESGTGNTGWVGK